MFSCVLCEGGEMDAALIQKVRNEKQRQYKEDCIKKEKLEKELGDSSYFQKKGKEKIDKVNKELEEKFKNK